MYLAAILGMAILIGLLLTVAVYHLFGDQAGNLFAKFAAGPLGLVLAFILFVLYDSIWPKRRSPDQAQRRETK